MLPQWLELNNAQLARLTERIRTTIPLPLADTTNVTTTVISGSLPKGLYLENNTITGTPFEVSRTTTYTFVIRASNSDGITDRTYKIVVDGPNNPVWQTPAGALGIGPNNVYYILDSSYIDFQLLATDRDLPAGDGLTYYIANGDGELPPGITLTSTGRLTGVVDPILALDINNINGNYDQVPYDAYQFDFNVVSGNGYASFYYDTTTYDFSVGTLVPKKLNRKYSFYVTVADNISFTKRFFTIYVITDDYTRADNTLVLADSGVYTSDLTFVRNPLWLTPSDLGIRRANNYQTLLLEILNPPNIIGTVQYELNSINTDGTPSVLPPGMSLDITTGEIAGRIPYQPAVTKTYNFTVTATRYSTANGNRTVFGTVKYDTLSGSDTIKIAKEPTTLTDGIDDLHSLIGQSIPYLNTYYTVLSVNDSNTDYDEVTFTTPLLPVPDVTPLTVVKTTNSENYFYVQTLSDFDRGFYKNKSLTYSSTESYKIISIYPYIQYKISIANTLAYIDLNTAITGWNGTLADTLASFLSTSQYPSYVTTVSGTNGIIEVDLIIPSTSTNRNYNFITSLFTTSDSSSVYVQTQGQFDRIELNTNLSRIFSVGRVISLGAYYDSSFNITFGLPNVTTASSSKQFTLRVLGEVDSTITWITPANLGTLNANRISTLAVKAKTNLVDGYIVYNLISGTLPSGITLNTKGELIGKVPVHASSSTPGLTFIDSGNTTFDKGTTSLDRNYTFTVLARDRAGFSATSRTFTLTISDSDTLNYSNIYMKPYLNSTSKTNFLSIIDSSSIISPAYIYRPSDPEFGLQRDLKALVYPGIESKDIASFMGAIGKNITKKKFVVGGLQTAVAKNPGTTETIYEVVYLDLIDPDNITNSQTRQYFYNSGNSQKITADSQRYETKDVPSYNPLNDDYSRFRPTNSNVITADNNAINISQTDNRKYYISNIVNVRKNIASVGISSRDFLPLWMRTPQGNSLVEPGFTLCIPLVYVLPGYGSIVKNLLANTNYDFSSINYEIDRFIIDSTQGYSGEQFLLFANYAYNV